MASTWAKITTNAGKFWDGLGDVFDPVSDAIDTAVDIVTAPKDLFQDSEGNYLGIEGLNTENIKKTAAQRQKRKNEQSAGGSSNPFDNRPGTDALATAESFIDMDEIIASTVGSVDPSVEVSNRIPGAGLLELAGIDLMDNSKKLYDIARGVSPNEIAGKIATRDVGPNIFIDDQNSAVFAQQPRVGPVSASNFGKSSFIGLSDKGKRLFSTGIKQDKASSEKFVDELIKRNK
jgi:hypothetical protein